MEINSNVVTNHPGMTGAEASQMRAKQNTEIENGIISDKMLQDQAFKEVNRKVDSAKLTGIGNKLNILI